MVDPAQCSLETDSFVDLIPTSPMDPDAVLLDTTVRCLARYETQFAGGPLLAAISGGRDSTLLLWVLAELRTAGRLPAPVIVAHVDHAARFTFQ